MYFLQVLNEDSGCASYFIASNETHEAAVIDPWYESGGYLDIAKARGYHIFYVIDTAVHLDHASGNRRVAMTAGGKVYVHEAIDTKYRFQPLKDGDVIRLGRVELRILHTPGRGPESISVVVVDGERSQDPALVMSGDSLFAGNQSQPRFHGPSGTAEEYESIQKLLALPDYVEVYPTHFVGPAGKGVFGRPSSTIGYERRNNPFLQMSRNEFLKLAGGPRPFRPLNAATIEEMNRGRTDQRWARGLAWDPAENLGAADAAAWVQEHRPLILDVREPQEYEAGHIPGAVSIPQYELGARMEEVPAGREVLVVCESGVRSARAAAYLLSQGRTKAMNLEGGANGWKEAGNPLKAGDQP